MHSFRASLGILLAAALVVSPAFATRTHRSSTAASAHRSSAHVHRTGARHGRSRVKKHVIRGQQAIDPERATQIQQALIREHYLTGQASGQWDAATVAAMQKYQADHGWQTKLTPDSRALKSLGLGPDYSNAINAKDATFTAPPPVSTIPAEEASGFAAAAKVNQ